MICLGDSNTFSYDMIGEFHSRNEWIHPRRAIQSYELILVLEGTVYIAEENQKYILEKNQMILLEPFREHFGYRTVSCPTSFYWLHFFTDMAPPLKTYTGNEIYEIKQLLKKLLHITNTPGYSSAAADAAAYLIFEELRHLSLEAHDSHQILSAQISDYIRSNLKSEITISSIAQQFGYNADYVGKYFKRTHGIGLKTYIADQKIALAKSLLLTTDMNIKQIAHELGYSDENLFIKFFIYHEDETPTAFKNKYCNTHTNNN